MNGFVISITRKETPVDLYVEPVNAQPDADGYVPYVIRGDWQVARVYVHVARYQTPVYETYRYAEQVAVYCQDAWLPIHEVKAIGDRLRLEHFRASRIS